MKTKKISSLLVCTLMSLSLLSANSKAEDISIKRVSGNDRYSTSIRVSSEFEKSDYVVLASGGVYPDALFGSTLASQENAPLLLNGKNSLSKDVANEIKRLEAKEVFVLGGENTLSKNIDSELESMGVIVTRLAGENRSETARKISEKRLELEKKKRSNITVISAGVDGYNFPDALVAGPFVAQYKKSNQIALLQPSKGVSQWQFGGDLKGIEKTFSGKDRYDTAVSVADSYKDLLEKDFDTVVLANGQTFPDALSASSLSSKYNSPILLTPSKYTNDSTLNFIKRHGVKNIIAVGGENSISTEVLNAYREKKSFKPQPKPIEKNNFVEASVVSVTDGDTIKVLVNSKQYTVRMIGVDTPETVHPNKPVQFFGREASNYTKSQLTGKKVFLQKDVSDTDKYGRLLRYVWIVRPSSNNPSENEIRNMMYNALLVKNGFAHASTYQPDSRYSKIFATLESEARIKNLGLWNKSKEAEFNNSKSTATNKNTTDKKPKNTANTNNTSGFNTDYNADTSYGKIKGNRKSMIYHVPGGAFYNKISQKNVVYFDSESQARAAGYRRAER